MVVNDNAIATHLSAVSCPGRNVIACNRSAVLALALVEEIQVFAKNCLTDVACQTVGEDLLAVDAASVRVHILAVGAADVPALIIFQEQRVLAIQALAVRRSIAALAVLMTVEA